MLFEEFKREETQIKNVWNFLKKTINAEYASTTIDTTPNAPRDGERGGGGVYSGGYSSRDS